MPDEPPTSAQKVEALERALGAARLELGTVAGSLDVVTEEHRRLGLLNGRLQEALERHRTTADDLRNVLYSTDVATLFLDADLRIRFFTPATRALFNLIPGDVGRPLEDLHSLAEDAALLADARSVLRHFQPLEREIEAGGASFTRRVLPYRAHDDSVEGVVITFTDVTERKRIAAALGEAKRQADVANAAKSRFLASASHDLRQPLQTLTLLQGLMVKAPPPERLQQLLARMDDALGAMSGMLNTLLDINQIEAGIVRADVVRFPLDDMLARLGAEFTHHADAQGIGMRVVPCGLVVESDPRLLEQMLRNLLANALKYTVTGRVLLGCRRRTPPGQAPVLAIEVWDTGIGIPPGEFEGIFEEYRQLDNPARDRRRGLGLGLPIVKRLANLLGHTIRVASRPGRGSVFAIDVAMPGPALAAALAPVLSAAAAPATAAPTPGGEILVIEDDAELRTLLALYLREEGHRPTTVRDGAGALALIARKSVRPDVIMTDYNLPGPMNGAQLAVALRSRAGRTIPVVILTGDTSPAVMRDVAAQGCIQLHKPVQLIQLQKTIRSLLPPRAPDRGRMAGSLKVIIVDDDNQLRQVLREVLQDDGRAVDDYPSGEAFVAGHEPGSGRPEDGCLLIDAALPGMSGLDLLHRLRIAGDRRPAIMITGQGGAHLAVEAMKAGAFDYLEKPIERNELLAAVERALELSLDDGRRSAWRDAAVGSIAGLTERQREVMGLVIAGHPSKNIAADLGISQRTVENHRAAIMDKTGSKSLPALARLAIAAAWTGPGVNGAGPGGDPEPAASLAET